MAAVTNDCRLSGIKQHKLIILQFCKLEGQRWSHCAETKVLAGHPLRKHSALEALGRAGKSISLPFPASTGPPRPLACGPSLHLQSQEWCVEAFSHCITMTSFSVSLFPLLRTL